MFVRAGIMLTTVEALKLLASGAGGIFAGGALYITVVEAPSRRDLPVEQLWWQWSRSFNRAARYMPFTGTLSTAASTALYFLDESPVKQLWLVATGTFLVGTLFTFGVIIPEVNVMLDEKIVQKKGERWTRDAITRWESRHLFRTLLDSVSYGFILYACLRS